MKVVPSAQYDSEGRDISWRSADGDSSGSALSTRNPSDDRRDRNSSPTARVDNGKSPSRLAKSSPEADTAVNKNAHPQRPYKGDSTREIYSTSEARDESRAKEGDGESWYTKYRFGCKRCSVTTGSSREMKHHLRKEHQCGPSASDNMTRTAELYKCQICEQKVRALARRFYRSK
jgi:hypothetical protein